jgi:Tfp pilus assembly protein PilF
MNRSDIERLCQQACDALHNGDHVRALAVADQLVAAAPDDLAVRTLRAEALLVSGAGEEALQESRRAVELEPENAVAHRLLGLSAWRCERLTLAQDSLERAVELSGRSPALLSEYAWFMASERGPRPAEQAARDAVAADESSSTAWAALGLAEYRLHRHRQAEASLQRALALDPNDLYAQSAMVVLLQDQRRNSEAMDMADRLHDTPGTEEFLQTVREETKQRNLAKMLVQCQAVPDMHAALWPRRLALWIVLVAALIGGTYMVLYPTGPGVAPGGRNL